ncbi:MAG: hypothetical protein LBD96_03325, partial [Treponema sp.]|nr:hypothetical protein [Treponema sp.]
MTVWSAAKANEWYRGKKWILGFNYVTSTAVNSTEMWQNESFDVPAIERELALASRYGYNSCRVFLQYLVWREEGEVFLRNFETFLGIAGKNGITVLPIFFDDCAFAVKEPYLGKQDDPRPDTHNSGWTPSPGFIIADDPASGESLKSYVQTLVRAHKDDERIIAWDLYNEPGNNGRGNKCLPLLTGTFAWARECNPAQPLTSGIYAWKDFDLSCAGLLDIISFHDYGDLENTKKVIQSLQQYGRPLLCTEWLHRPTGNTIESHLPLYKAENIGAYH